MRSTTRSWPRTLLVGFTVIVAVEFVIMEVWIGDGLDGLTREERAGAQRTIDMARAICLDNPIAYALTRKIRVVEVAFMPGCKRMDYRPVPMGPSFGQPNVIVQGGYRVVLQVYSVFAFPLVRIIECCNSGEFCMWWTGDSPIPDPCPSS